MSLCLILYFPKRDCFEGESEGSSLLRCINQEAETRAGMAHISRSTLTECTSAFDFAIKMAIPDVGDLRSLFKIDCLGTKS